MKKTYNEKEIVEILQSDIEVPDIVKDHIEDAFDTIRKNKFEVRKGKHGNHKKAVFIILSAAMLGTLTVGAATIFAWNRDVAEKFDVDEIQQQQLAEKKVTVPIEASATDNGVTINVEQALTVDEYMYLYFKITAPEDMLLPAETLFEQSTLTVDGKDIEANYCGGLPDLSEDGKDNVTYWEWWVQFDDGTKILEGKELTAHFENMIVNTEKLGIPDKMLAEGTWDITWPVEYDSSEKTFHANQELGDAGITVKEVAISPISLKISYGWRRNKLEDEAFTEDGRKTTYTYYEEPPVYATSYRLKDGSTVEINGGGPGYSGYVSEDEGDDTYVESVGCTKAYEVENIAGIIFSDRNSEKTYEVTF